MKRFALYIVIIVSSLSVCRGQDDFGMKYRRNSVYSLLISHTEQQDYALLIRGQFLNIPIPDKYNDHNLSVNVVEVNNKNAATDEAINSFIADNKIASRMVAKWFNRDPRTGVCDMELVKNRGLYNASVFDQWLASKSIRGNVMLQDAGEDLISNTYLIVNEVSYLDKGKVSHIVGLSIMTLVYVAYAAYGKTLSDENAEAIYKLVAGLKGFSVKITSRLYQLDWNEDIANTFYSEYYTDTPDEAKRLAFEQHRDDFKMKYIGQVESKGNTTSFNGINEKQPWLMVRKACERAIDENIVDLQKEFPVFRVKSLITEVSAMVKVPIGKKDGVEAGKKYEVLEAVERNGRVVYQRVGVVTPNPTLIWDNRFMAVEEGAIGAELGATSFVIISGSNIEKGMLIREL